MMNGTDGLSANTTAILLLTAPLVVGSRRSLAPVLTAGEYRKLAPLLASHQSEPAALLESGADRLLAQCGDLVEEDRLTALLNRGFQLSQAVERWHARGIWVVSRADEAYPPSLKKRLKNDAPSVLYGCGLQDIMHNRSLAIVGSRDASEPLIEYTQRTAALVARSGVAVVSGGARGVDRAAMNGAMEAGGTIVGVLPGDLEKTVMTREHRNRILKEQLVLVSPFDPSLRFTVAQAMQRNKVIYALAEAGLVVNADFNRGGTWAGAVEQLKKYFVPVFVRSTGDPSEGLTALQDRGARSWPEPEDPDEFEVALGRGTPPVGMSADDIGPVEGKKVATTSPDPIPEPSDTSCQVVDYARLLFRDVESCVKLICAEPRSAKHVAAELGVPVAMASAWLRRLAADGAIESLSRDTYVASPGDSEPRSSAVFEPAPSARCPGSSCAELLFQRVDSHLQSICAVPKGRKTIADDLDVSTTTLNPWLNRLVAEHALVKETAPVRYVVAPPELPLE